MNLLITGGAGFIGSHVLETLQDKANITVVDNLSSGSRQHVPPHIEFIKEDIRDAKAMDTVFVSHSFQAVIHLAAQTLVPASIANPV